MNGLADVLLIGHVGLSQLLKAFDDQIVNFALLFLILCVLPLCLAQLQEIVSVLNRFVELASLVLDESDALIALSFNLDVFSALSHVQTPLEVVQCLSEVSLILLRPCNLHVDLDEVG